jgi:flagellar biosynthesis GTPase FlhF
MPDAPMTPRRRVSDVDEDGYVVTPVVPTPDPTALTTAALHRETGVLRESMDQRFADRDREARNLSRERTEQFAALRELLLGHIESLDRLTDERFSGSKSAVESALIAQKDAVREQTTASDRAIAKSESATTKQLEQQSLTVTTAFAELRRSIDEVKERAVEENRAMRTSISDVATTANGTVQQKVGAKEDRSALYATIGILISVLILVLALAGFLATRPGV